MRKSALRLALPAGVLLAIVSCAALLPGQDPVLVRAEQTEKVAFYTLDAFVNLERAQGPRLELLVPGIHAAAEAIRNSGPPALRDLRGVIDAYRSAKTGPKPDLAVALAVVQTLLTDAQEWLTQAAAAGVKKAARILLEKDLLQTPALPLPLAAGTIALTDLAAILTAIEGLASLYPKLKEAFSQQADTSDADRQILAQAEERAFAGNAWKPSAPSS